MNKKTYILSFIAITLLVGVVWYGSQGEGSIVDQAASIIGGNQEEASESSILSEEVLGDFILGNPEAEVTMTEYTSHFCGHCANFHKDILPLLIDKYIKTGKIKFIFRYVSPLEISMAINCAQEEGKFLEMSNHFFENIQEISSADDVKIVALQIISNQESFSECYDSNKYEEKIKGWFDKATEVGVEGTPTFFVNDEKIVGNQPITIFEEAIERALGQ